jgi:hypothetical protein
LGGFAAFWSQNDGAYAQQSFLFESLHHSTSKAIPTDQIPQEALPPMAVQVVQQLLLPRGQGGRRGKGQGGALDEPKLLPLPRSLAPGAQPACGKNTSQGAEEAGVTLQRHFRNQLLPVWMNRSTLHKRHHGLEGVFRSILGTVL